MKINCDQQTVFRPIRLVIDIESLDEARQLYNVFNLAPICNAIPAVASSRIRDVINTAADGAYHPESWARFYNDLKEWFLNNR